jgi:hypothetical protein
LNPTTRVPIPVRQMTFLCVPIEYDHAAGDVHRYVHDHLDLNCDNEEYSRTSELAYFMVAVWPLGLPFLYALLLGASHRALSVGNGKMTQMGRMTAFLIRSGGSSLSWVASLR